MARTITNVTRTALGKETLFGTNSLKEGVIWHVEPFLGNGCEGSSYKTAVPKYLLLNRHFSKATTAQ
jgi:hypothetical protein